MHTSEGHHHTEVWDRLFVSASALALPEALVCLGNIDCETKHPQTTTYTRPTVTEPKKLPWSLELTISNPVSE